MLILLFHLCYYLSISNAHIIRQMSFAFGDSISQNQKYTMQMTATFFAVIFLHNGKINYL